MNASYQKIDLTPDSLAGIHLLSELERAERGKVLRYCEGRRYGKGQEIISHQDKNRDVFFVVSGLAKATIYSPSGRRVTFQVLGAGETFGELAALDKKVRSASVVTMEDALVVRMSESGFLEMVSTHPVMASQLLKRLSKLIRFLCERIYELHACSVKERVCAELWRLVESGGKSLSPTASVISPAPTHADIASSVGSIRETVTRELLILKNDGVIEGCRGRLTVKDCSALRSRVERAAQCPNEWSRC